MRDRRYETAYGGLGLPGRIGLHGLDQPPGGGWTYDSLCCVRVCVGHRET
jgi:hypothetical protein